MSQCDTCKNSGDCKEREAYARFKEMFGEAVGACSGYEYRKPLTPEMSCQKRIENQREEIRRLREHNRNLEQSRNHWKRKAKMLGKQLCEVLERKEK